jgi:hypothetical protein
VLFQGRVPPPVIAIEGGGVQDVLEVDPKSGGVAFVVVSLDAAPEASGAPLPATEMDQYGWMFRPPVLAVREGQSVVFSNSDGFNHNVRSNDNDPANRFSGYPTPVDPFVWRFRSKADRAPVILSCDLHSWMVAWIYVFDHPYFAVTDTAGQFQISQVPPGTYRLQVRHPGGGLRRTLTLEVTPGVTIRKDVVFETVDLYMDTSALRH